jgi:hypothetical protein
MLLEMNYVRFMLSSEELLCSGKRTETTCTKLQNKIRAKNRLVWKNDKIEENSCVVRFIFEGRDVRIESRKGNKKSYSRKLNRDLRMEKNVLREML